RLLRRELRERLGHQHRAQEEQAMSTETVNTLVDRLTQPGALTVERFAELLGASLTPQEINPFWRTYVFELAGGPFARGEVRLHTSEPAALLILEPRDPPGLGPEDVDRAALGERTGMRPDPRIPPEGTETEFFQR